MKEKERNYNVLEGYQKIQAHLDELSKKYKISRERIRQIETKAFEKLQKSMINASKSKNLLPAK